MTLFEIMYPAVGIEQKTHTSCRPRALGRVCKQKKRTLEYPRGREYGSELRSVPIHKGKLKEGGIGGGGGGGGWGGGGDGS